MILDVSNKYKTPTSSNNRDNIVNFANAFQGEDLDVENLIFEREDGNNKIKGEDGVIKDEK